MPLKRRPAGSLLVFFALTFAISEPCFIAGARLSSGLAPGAPLGPAIWTLITLGTFAPGIVAVALSAYTGGRSSIVELLATLVRWQAPVRAYVFAAGYMIAIKLAAAAAHRAMLGTWPRWGETPLPLLLAATVFSTVVGGQAGEELGWRGYALPKLAARVGLGPASVVLGVIWASWHLPLFYLHGADTYQQSFPVYALQVTAISVAIAWLWWRTGGSLLLTMLMHAAINNTKDIVPAALGQPPGVFTLGASPMSWLGAALLWAVAIACLANMRGRRRPLESGQTGALLPAAGQR